MAKAIPTPHSAKVFCARKTLRVFLIGHKKPSFTAGTLCAIKSEIIENGIKYHWK
jgi:hypothetical protein